MTVGIWQNKFYIRTGSEWYAELYKKDGLSADISFCSIRRHQNIIKKQNGRQCGRLEGYPGGLQIGGGITAEIAKEYLDAGASHVIVTSYVFRDGKLDFENLAKLEKEVGKKRIVLDLSCRKRGVPTIS